MQVTIARQLSLEPITVGNFFMKALRRAMDKWHDDVTQTENDNLNSYQHNYHNREQRLSMSPTNRKSLDLNDDRDIDLDLIRTIFEDKDPEANFHPQDDVL